ncbi:MAG: hypothetical protein HC895_24130 [Leptolyngbyaceae cyanobacterium SM1_3_5]|nr:hypothetical protein [Leptolyngbyaceae cyanobacterium SM1_3_5]
MPLTVADWRRCRLVTVQTRTAKQSKRQTQQRKALTIDPREISLTQLVYSIPQESFQLHQVLISV